MPYFGGLGTPVGSMEDRSIMSANGNKKKRVPCRSATPAPQLSDVVSVQSEMCLEAILDELQRVRMKLDYTLSQIDGRGSGGRLH